MRGDRQVLGGDVVEIHLCEPQEVDHALAAVSVLHDGGSVDRERQRITLPAPDGIATLRRALDCLDAEHVRIDDIGLRRPSLDDVFLALTGHGTAEEAAPSRTAAAAAIGEEGGSSMTTDVAAPGVFPGTSPRRRDASLRVWLYALIGLLVKDPETAQLTGFVPIFPFIFASAIFVPVQNMPGWLQAFARNSR